MNPEQFLDRCKNRQSGPTPFLSSKEGELAAEKLREILVMGKEKGVAPNWERLSAEYLPQFGCNLKRMAVRLWAYSDPECRATLGLDD